MVDTMEYLNDRDDVARTEYTRRDAKTMESVTVELWHDPDALNAIFQKAMEGGHSPRSLRQFAKERALAVRETRLTHDAQAIASSDS